MTQKRKQKQRKAHIALVYDFDGTLAPGNMQEQSFLPAIEVNKKKFWAKTKAKAKSHDMDEILAYMELMLEESRAKDTPIKRDVFAGYGRNIEFFPGVTTWFGRIGKVAKKQGVVLSHYIISSGNKETIEGTSIAKHFERVFASCFRYDVNGVAVWPAVAINYTAKAEFLFRINKGIESVYDNTKINEYTPEEERPYPFKNFIYIGDGLTDVPAMKMVTYQGGRSIVVYKSRKKGARKAAHALVEQHRADIAVPADYSAGKLLDKAVKSAIEQIAARHRFEKCDTSPLKGLRPPK